MKLYSIFSKNLKTVSRNWSYFFVLILCPIILILSSGIMLKSIDMNNVKIGIVLEKGETLENYPFDFRLSNFDPFSSKQSCLEFLSKRKISACVDLNLIENFYTLDVYLDRSRKVVEYYAKQAVLSFILQDQSAFIEQTSQELSSRIVMYSVAISDSKEELANTKKELESQKQTLILKKQKLAEVKQEFDSVYIPLKQLEPEIDQLREDLENSIEQLEISSGEIDNIYENLNALQNFLLTVLNLGQYNYTNGFISEIYGSLQSLELTLNQAEQSQRDLFEAIELVGEIMPRLDFINQTLYETDEDFTEMIEKTDKTIVKVDSFIVQMDEASEEINSLSEKFDRKPFVLNFVGEGFSVDPILNFFPLLVAIVITFTSLVLSNMFVLKQVNRSSYFREVISPTKDIQFILADYFVNLFFVFIEASILFLIGFFWVGFSLELLLPFYLVIFIGASLFLFIGMGLGYLIKSQSLSLLLTIFTVMLLLILSDLIAPSILLSSFVKFFINRSPFVILIDLIEGLFVLGKTLSELSTQLTGLSFYLGFAFLFAFFSKKFSKRNIYY